MKGFARVLSESEIAAVVTFIDHTFITAKRPNTRYHTPENGWDDHQRYRAAFPFARGEIPLDAPDASLSPEALRGKRLFMSACIVCHDRGRLNDDRTVWEPRAVSWPRGGYSHRRPAEGGADAVSGATPFARHDVPPPLSGLTERERRGETLYQQNCAFCHAADGSGRNWIGSFLQPHPRDLTAPQGMRARTPRALRRVIADGLPGTTMPAWKTVLSGEEIDAVAAYVERAFLGAHRDAGPR